MLAQGSPHNDGKCRPQELPVEETSTNSKRVTAEGPHLKGGQHKTWRQRGFYNFHQPSKKKGQVASASKSSLFMPPSNVIFSIWVFPKIGVGPQIIHFNRVLHYKPSILGCPYFWKHPYRFPPLKSVNPHLVSARILSDFGKDLLHGTYLHTGLHAERMKEI